jgi:hypothetical protein
MKALLLTTSLLFSLNSFSKATLICHSQKKVEGWNGSSTFDKVKFTSYIRSETELESAEVSGAFMTDNRDLQAEIDEDSRKYKRVRFGVLEDAWCWFNVLLPKNFARRTRNFAGSIQYTCESWQYRYEYIDMDCFILD